MNAPIPTPEELTALCREWQKRLRLQDWRVQVRYSKEFELDGLSGSCWPNDKIKAAAILINRCSQKGDNGEAWSPVEVTLIHELLHLHFQIVWTAKSGTIEDTNFEQAIESVAWGLYRAKHGDKAVDEFVEPCAAS